MKNEGRKEGANGQKEKGKHFQERKKERKKERKFG